MKYSLGKLESRLPGEISIHPGTFFVEIFEQMSMVNFMDYSLGTAVEGFVPSHAPLKNNKHLNILSSQLNLRKERTSQNHKT